MQVGVKLCNFAAGGDGVEVFTEAVELSDGAWLAAQKQVFEAVMAGIRDIIVVLTPEMRGDSGIITIRAGDRLTGDEITYIGQVVDEALAPFRAEGAQV